MLGRYCEYRYASKKSGDGEDVPRQLVAVMGVKDPSSNPRRTPLSQRVARDNNRQKFPERLRSKTFGCNQRNQHVVRTHRETKNHYEGPDRGRVMHKMK